MTYLSLCNVSLRINLKRNRSLSREVGLVTLSNVVVACAGERGCCWSVQQEEPFSYTMACAFAV